MAIEQLEFFPLSEEERNQKRIEEIHKSLDKVRKGMFARLNICGKDILSLHERLERIEKYICTVSPKSNPEFKFDEV